MTISSQCQNYHWPREPISDPESDEHFDEGPFLRVLLDRVSHILDQVRLYVYYNYENCLLCGYHDIRIS